MTYKNRRNLIGKIFGRLTVLSETDQRYHGSIVYRCICTCGNEKLVPTEMLRTSKTRSCGCLSLESKSSKINKHQLPSTVASFNRLYCSYKHQAKLRNYEFTLSIDEFRELTKQNCFYCNEEPAQRQKAYEPTGSYIYNGIDRIDNTIGYTLDNCVPCCGKCNRAKDIQSLEEFEDWIIKVYDHRYLGVN